jgi:molecular chaperone DnaK
MVCDAEAHAEEDRRRREEADVRNQADTLVYQTERLLRDQGDQVGPADRDQVEAALGELREKLGGSDIDGIRAATDRLATASQVMTQKLYERATSAAPDDEEVVEAEIVDGGAAA